MFAMACVMVNSSPRKTYWVKNQDGTVSIWIRINTESGSKEKVAELIDDVRKSVMEIGERASRGSGRIISCNSFLGSDKDKNLEVVGMAMLECNDSIENELERMNVVKVS